MEKKEIINYCLLDENVSLEAKGLYSIIQSMVSNEDTSLKRLYELANEDKNYLNNLILELVENNFLYLSLPKDLGDCELYHIFKGKIINDDYE
ncbi:MAG: hypothetical protein WCR80_02645 [Bacilli bacterium]